MVAVMLLIDCLEIEMQVTQKPQTAFVGGVPVHVANEVRQNGPDFYISYNASSGGYGCPTTAIVVNNPQMSAFYVLCGDHRKQYEEAETLAACLAYFASNPALQHEYSDKLQPGSGEVG